MGRRVTGTSDGGQANPDDHNGQTTTRGNPRLLCPGESEERWLSWWVNPQPSGGSGWNKL